VTSPLNVHPIRRQHLLILLLILCIAAFARLQLLGATHFLYDEGILSRMAQDWLAGGEFPRRGLIASVGLPQGPYMVYLLAVPFALRPDPLFATGFIALWNVLGVGCLWWFAHRYFSPRVGWLAALAFALSPWAIHFSRAIWNPDMHTTFLLIGLALGGYGFWEGRRWAQAVSIPILLLPAQFHYQGALLVFVLLALLWIGRKQLSWGAVAIGIGLTVLSLTPLVSSFTPEDIAHFQNELSGGEGGGIQPTTQALDYVFQLATGSQVSAALIYWNSVGDLPTHVPAPDTLWLALALLLLLGLVMMWGRYAWLAWLLASWIIPTVAALTLNLVEVQMHYFILLMPALFIVIGIGMEQIVLWLAKWRYVQAVAAVLFVIVLATQGLWMRTLFAYLDSHPLPDPYNGYVTPLGHLMRVREALADYDDVIIVGGNPFLTTDSSVWKPLLWRQAECVRDLIVDGGSITVLPQGRFAMLLPPQAAPNDLTKLYQHDNPITVELRPGEAPYTIYGWDAAPEWTQSPLTDVTALRFDNGIRLTGYHLGDGMLHLRWQVVATHPERNHQYFAHFLDAAGEKIGQRDSSFYNIGYWCEGDTLITSVSADIPPDVQTLRVGMYGKVDGRNQNAAVLDETGNPVGQWVDVPVEK
jgi:hypothetical protein